MITLLAGCGGKQATPEATTAGSPNETEKEKVSINFYTWANGVSLDQTNQIIANFEKINPHIDVVAVPLVTNANTIEYYKKLDLIAASGDPIDVAAFSSVDFVNERASRNVLEPLDDYLSADGINVDESYYMTPKSGGKVYGLQEVNNPWLVAINKDALDEANLPIPTWGWTWDDFREYAQKMTKGSGEDKQYGAFFHTWGEYANPTAFAELPHPYLTKEQTPVFGDESFAKFFEFRRAMEKEDQSVKPYSDVLGAKLRYDTEFLNGKAAMIPTATFIVNLVQDTEKFPHTFKTVFAPLPRSSEDAEIGLSIIGGGYASVGKTSKHKQESYEFVKYLTQQTDVVRDFPGSKSADKNKVMEGLVRNHDLVDTDSLAATVFDERIKTIYDPTYSTDFASQLKSVLENGLSTFLLDNLSAEDAQKQMIDEANKIIQQNK